MLRRRSGGMTLAKIRHLKDGRGKEGRGGAAWKGKESLGLLERAEGGGQCCPCCDREHNRLRLCCCCCCRVAKISSAAVLQTGSLSLSLFSPLRRRRRRIRRSVVGRRLPFFSLSIRLIQPAFPGEGFDKNLFTLATKKERTKEIDLSCKKIPDY